NGNFALANRCSGTTNDDGGSYSSKSIFISSGFSCCCAHTRETDKAKKTSRILFILELIKASIYEF
ncbi:MAG TPA: hypothetical protein DGG95_03335, partial [Cytophagales bacterium]|nr:hypothetical protein [Cytophagales bacterium]